MKKLITYIIFVTALILVSAGPVVAFENTSEESATIRTDNSDSGTDLRVIILRNFFEKYDSPLAAYSEEFIYWADQYQIDWRMVPAITGVESTFGKRIPVNSFNAYGWANGNFSFTSWDNSISVVTQSLRKNYIDKGADTIPEIARIYAPPSITWGGKVKTLMGKIDALPVPYDI